MIRIKPGVKLAGLKLEMQAALDITELIYHQHGQTLVITEAIRPHDKKSKHSKGLAFDIRTRFFEPEEIQEVHYKLHNLLKHHYDVILERDHIHIEWEPK